MNGPQSKRPLVVLVGATASGKTELALEAARRAPFPIEAISLDSRQIYRRLDRGTGKPTPAELDALPHHLIDFIEPDQSYDAGRYRRAVEELLPTLWERGIVPMVVGGAGFYLRALREGFFELPEDETRLVQIRAELERQELSALRARLERIDPVSAQRIHANDRYRTERALELHALTGRSMSELMDDFVPQPVLDCELQLFHVQRPRWQLHTRIKERAARWLEQGWIEETKALLTEGWAPDCPGLGILGYREIVAMIQGDLERRQLHERILIATRRYARQQEVWFRKCAAERRGTAEDPRFAEALDAALHNAAAGWGAS